MVATFMPGATGVVQDAGVPGRPSISTRQTRHEPNDFRRVGGAELGDVDAGLGGGAHDRRALGNGDGNAVDLDLDQSARPEPPAYPCRAGHRTASGRLVKQCHDVTSCAVRPKSSGNLVSALRTGIGVSPPMAQSDPSVITSHRSSSTCEVALAVVAGGDAVDHLDAADRADPARRALAARLLGAELHGEACQLGHVGGVVVHDDAAVADHRARRGERLVLDRQVELVAVRYDAERAAHLDGADRTSGRGAAAEVFDQLAQRDAEPELDHAALLDVAGQLEHLGAERPVEPAGRVRVRTFGRGRTARCRASARC